jgi:K+ transporter
MTLRKLLKETPYKSVFNVIYKTFYQQKKYLNSKIIEADVAYSKVCKDLIDLPENKIENQKIYLANVADLTGEIDVCLLDEVEDELYSFDFVPWRDIIDLEILKTAKISTVECLAHILWEMTFWGFSEEQIEKQKQITIDAGNEK